MTGLSAMVRQYVVTALWSSTTDDETPMDRDYGPDDISPETLATMRADCEAFATANADDLAGIDDEQIGHDLWLTRNHHGAGFWDRGLGDLGSRLTDAANACGSYDLYVGDDGRIYGA